MHVSMLLMPEAALTLTITGAYDKDILESQHY